MREDDNKAYEFYGYGCDLGSQRGCNAYSVKGKEYEYGSDYSTFY